MARTSRPASDRARPIGGGEVSGETWGDMARPVLEARGALHPVDVMGTIRQRMAALDLNSRVALAAAVAARLIAMHMRLAEAEQRPYTLEWADAPDLAWSVVLANDRQAFESLRGKLEVFRQSPFNHCDGQDGPDDADDDAVAACIYTAEALCEANEESAYWAAHRLVDWAFASASDILESGGVHVGPAAEFIEGLSHPLVQRELRRLLEAVQLLDREGLSASTAKELRALFEAA